jgi:signal transduction histidine kinase
VAEFMKTLIQSLEEEHQKTDEMITTISAGVNYVSSILSLQRSYYAPEKNEMKETINLNELIDDALRIHESSIAKREIRVEKNFLSDIPLFPMEKNKLVQVLVNLVKNSCDAIDQYSAIKHGQQHWICFTTFFDGHKIGMSISDSGYGVEKERQNEIFEFGVSSKGSSGFGLYYCKNFLEANNGTLTLESEGKGKGAKVILEILIAVKL